MFRALSISALILAAVVFVPFVMDSSVAAAPPTAYPGVPGEPGEAWPECPWIATIEIIDCSTGQVIGWRSKSVFGQHLCSSAIAELTASATGTHHECVGGNSCVEYRWCED